MGREERRQVARDGRVGRVGQAELLEARTGAGRVARRGRPWERSRRPAGPGLPRGVTSICRPPPISREPLPGRLTVSRSGAFGPSSVSLTCRQVRTSTAQGRGSSLPLRATAAVRGDGPRPDRDCRRRGSGGRRRPRGGSGPCRDSSARTRISVKSDVPPPMSQTRIFWPGLTRSCQSVAVAVDPGVEGGLRLLDQHHAGQPGPGGRLDGQLAGHLVERGRQREHEVLLGERAPGKVGVPGGADVGQVAAGRPRRARAARRRRRRATAASGPCGPRPSGTATTWPRRSAGRARGCRGRGRRSRRVSAARVGIEGQPRALSANSPAAGS